MAEMHTIFDRASKRCISLSKRSTILLINGMYEKDYSLDSEVEYHWTEHHDDELRKTLADTIITIDHRDSYHLEIQMYPDEEIVLIPFQLLRLRKVIEKERTEKNMEQLKNLIFHDIIGIIEANVSAGNITRSVGRKLKRITLQLYRHIYEKYDEMERSGVNAMVEEALVLDIDIIEAEHKKDIDRLEAEHERRLEKLEAEHEQHFEQLAAEHEQQIVQMAQKLLRMGMEVSAVCEVTGLTSEKVNRLRG